MSKDRRPFLIQSENGKKDLYAYLKALPLPYSIEIFTGENRTLAQNALYHSWVNIISKETGQVPSEIKMEIQAMFLPTIEKELNGFKFVILTSTKDLSIQEMSTFLEQIQAYYATEHQIILPYLDPKHRNNE